MKILVIATLIVLLSVMSINDVFAWEVHGNTVSGVFKSTLLIVSVQDENYQPYSSLNVQNVPVGTPFSFELPAMESGTYRVIIKQGNIGAESEISEFFNYIAPLNEEQETDEIEKINPENEYLTKEREWLTSGPFQIDRSKYAVGEKIFLVVDGLDENEKGQIAFMRPLNATPYSVYITIPFDGSTKPSFNYYVEPQLSKIKELCSVEDLIGKWTVVFRGTTYSNLDFEITQDVIPGTNIESVCPNTIKESHPTTKVPNWVKNNAKWWADGQVDDQTFTQGIGFLIKEKVIEIDDLPKQSSTVSEEKVPAWIKNNAKWWADGMITEDDFIKGIEYLVEKGIVRTN